MRTTTLGRTGIEVSRICFGTWQLGGDWGGFDRHEATRAIQYARELGINFFDTAQGYGWGASERLLGGALRDELDNRRDELVIATKGGLRMTDDGLKRDSSPDWIRSGVDASLEALGVDYIDLYQIHWPDPDTPFAETAGALAELVDAGKVRHVGVSNFSAQQIEEFSRTLQVETDQPAYHLFRREIEDELLPYCREHDIGVLVYGPLAHGLLTGAMDESTTFAEDDWRSQSSLFQGDAFERNLAVVERLRELAEARGYGIGRLAIAWTLAQPGVHVAIVGARSAAHIRDSAEAAAIDLTDDDLREINTIMSDAAQVAGPSPESV